MQKNLWNIRWFSVYTLVAPLIQLWLNSLYLICSNYVQNKRGGKVKLYSLMMPIADYDHLEKGDALYGRLRASFYILLAVYSKVFIYNYSFFFLDLPNLFDNKLSLVSVIIIWFYANLLIDTLKCHNKITGCFKFLLRVNALYSHKLPALYMYTYNI